MRNWAWEDVQNGRPLFQSVRPPNFGGQAAIAVRVGNKTYRIIWVDGRPVTDLPPFGDPSAYSLKCPFLMDDTGDGTHPCALVGTPFQGIWDVMCQPYPSDHLDDEQVADWEMRHPLCSYVYVEE